ncbi:unnamed protein product [Hermetia illucens]|uniref:VWFC domain-containing protein n=1 Tax=Hermetia illucens TaxID=343691 RepID=A0A7R8YPN1_HERIL|nr:unnamed protein product [Hermetia illucens]
MRSARYQKKFELKEKKRKIAFIGSAPLHESTDLEQYSGTCYYNYNHYNEGDRILTNEPCLNCTCHNQMLMCYLRVCPFTKPIGHDCVVEKREDQCCPIITCPDVPVELVDHKSDSKNEIGFAEKYGCYIENKFYPEGAQVPSNPHKPCELCYCIRNRTSCLMQECTLHVDGCQPIYNRGVCCPVRYDCEHDSIISGGPYLEDSHTTVRPTEGFILTTLPSIKDSSSCVYNDETFADGALIPDTKPCEHCYCMKGDIVCAVQECAIPIEHPNGKNCTYLPPPAGECCPQSYICQDDDIIHNILDEKHDLESSHVDGAITTVASLGAQEEGGEETGTTESSGDLHHKLHETVSEEDVQLQEHIDDIIQTSTVKSSEPEANQEGAEGTTISSTGNIKFAQEATTQLPESQTHHEEEGEPIHEAEHPLDIIDSTQRPVEDLATEQPIKSEQGIEQELTPTTDSLESTYLTPNEIVPIIIPGEGDCLYNNVTYKNNTEVPSVTKCDEHCICLSSIIKCRKVECVVALGANCRVVESSDPDACCPTYECEQDEPTKDHATEQAIDEEKPATTVSSLSLEQEESATVGGEDSEKKDHIEGELAPGESAQPGESQSEHELSEPLPTKIVPSETVGAQDQVEVEEQHAESGQALEGGLITDHTESNLQGADEQTPITHIQEQESTDSPAILSPQIPEGEQEQGLPQGAGSDEKEESAHPDHTEASEQLHPEQPAEGHEENANLEPESAQPTDSPQTESAHLPTIGVESEAKPESHTESSESIIDQEPEKDISQSPITEISPETPETYSEDLGLQQPTTGKPPLIHYPIPGEQDAEKEHGTTEKIVEQEIEQAGQEQSTEGQIAGSQEADLDRKHVRPEDIPETTDSAPSPALESMSHVTTVSPAGSDKPLEEHATDDKLSGEELLPQTPSVEKDQAGAIPSESPEQLAGQEEPQEQGGQDQRLEGSGDEQIHPDIAQIPEEAKPEQPDSDKELTTDELMSAVLDILKATDAPLEEQPLTTEKILEKPAEELDASLAPETEESKPAAPELPIDEQTHKPIDQSLEEKPQESAEKEPLPAEGQEEPKPEIAEPSIDKEQASMQGELPSETPAPSIEEAAHSTETSVDKQDQELEQQEPEKPLEHGQVPEDINIHHPSDDKDHVFSMMVDNFEEKTTAQPEIAVGQPAEEQLAEGQSTESQLSEGELVESQPAESLPVESHPAEGQSAESLPEASQPAGSLPSESQPTETQPGEGQLAESQPAEGQSVESLPAAGQTDETLPSEGQSTESLPADGQSTERLPAGDHPAESQPAEGQSAESLPTEGQPAESQPAVDQSTDSLAAGGQPTESQPAESEGVQIPEAEPTIPSETINQIIEDAEHQTELPVKHTEIVGTIKPEGESSTQPGQSAEQPDKTGEHPSDDERKEDIASDLTTTSSILAGADKQGETLETATEIQGEHPGPSEAVHTGEPSESAESGTPSPVIPEKEDEHLGSDINITEGSVSADDKQEGLIEQTEATIKIDEQKEQLPEEHIATDRTPIEQAQEENLPTEHVPEEHTIATGDQTLEAQTPASEQPAPAIEEHSPALEEHVPALEEHTPASEEHAPAIEDQTPAPVEHEPALEEHTPVTEEHAPTIEEHTPASEEHAPALEEHTPVPEEHAPALEEHTPASEELVPALEEHTPASQEEPLKEIDSVPTSQPIPEENVNAIDGSLPEEHAAAPEQEIPEEQTSAPAVQIAEEHTTSSQEAHPEGPVSIPADSLPESPEELVPQSHVTESPEELTPEAHVTDGQLLEGVTSSPAPAASLPDETKQEAPESHPEPGQLPESQTEAGHLPESHTELEHLPESHTESEQLPESQTETGHLPETHLGAEPESHTESEQVPQSPEEAVHLPESHLESEHLPEGHTEYEHLPESQTELEHLPESHTESEHLPQSHTESAHLPESHPELEQLPESHTESAEAPEGHVELGSLPEGHPEEEHLPESQTELAHLPESHTESEQLPETHAEDAASQGSLPESGSELDDTLKGEISESTTLSSSTAEEAAKPALIDEDLNKIKQPAIGQESGLGESTTVQSVADEKISTEQAILEEAHPVAQESDESAKPEEEADQHHIKDHLATEQAPTIKPDVEEHKTESSLAIEEATHKDISTDGLSQTTEAYESLNKTEHHGAIDAAAPEHPQEQESITHEPQTTHSSHPHHPHKPHYPTSGETHDGFDHGSHPAHGHPGSGHFGVPGTDSQPTEPDFGPLPGHYPSFGGDEDYTEEEDPSAFGPGTCRYGGKLFVSAQQIPRDDPCDFCFCFRSDIICLQQSCPPPISGCHEEPISGFCCPRYECPVLMGGVLNLTTTTTTTTTVPPLAQHRPSELIKRTGCYIGGQSYKVGEAIDSASGPCIQCSCGGDGQMKCEPKVCTPEPMLRQMIAVVASRRR